VSKLRLSPADHEVIRATVLFGKLGPDDYDCLIQDRGLTVLQRGDQLFEQGEPALALFVVLAGQIKLTRLNAAGDEAVVHVFGPRESFAEPAMFMGGVYPVSAFATCPSRVLAIDARVMEVRIGENPKAAFAMLASVSRHLKELVGQIEAMKLLTSEERLVQFLTSLSDIEEGPARFDLPHDKTLLAKRLCMQPETLSRTLARLKADGVEVHGSHITVADMARLRQRGFQAT
jgi:CRP-like cAMP-binding protein